MPWASCFEDMCYLTQIQNYGLESARVAQLTGFDVTSCAKYAHLLDFTDQARHKFFFCVGIWT